MRKPHSIRIVVYQEPPEEFELEPNSIFKRWICHQRPDRSFFIGDWQLPLCARCLGVYFSLSCSIPLSWIVIKRIGMIGFGNMSLLTALAVIPLLVDGFTQLFELRKSNNPLRLTTGLLAGVGLGSFVGYSIYWLALQIHVIY